MNKKIIVDENDQTNNLGAVRSVKPIGTQVLLELLTPQEMLGTKVIVNDMVQHKEFHGIVVSVGNLLDMSKQGFKIGDRVLLSGTGVPVPNYDNSNREKILMEPFCIKAILNG
jgi:co-chaperonin GroES (HSP10)